MEKKVAVIGGSGFVGSNIARHISRQYDVRVLDIRPPLNIDLPFKHCDILDSDALADCLQDFDLVINTAIIQLPRINDDKKRAYEVNVKGLQNLCQTVNSLTHVGGLIHAGSWHVFGEHGFHGVLREDYGLHPDRVEERSKFYTLCKIAQESLVQMFQEFSDKHFGVIRLGTVLGEEMPKQTAASIFIENGLRGKPITPYAASAHRPMFYTDIRDVCHAFSLYARQVLSRSAHEKRLPLSPVNLFYPRSITVFELAQAVRRAVMACTRGRVRPRVEVLGEPVYAAPPARVNFSADITKARRLLGVKSLTKPTETIRRIILHNLQKRTD